MPPLNEKGECKCGLLEPMAEAVAPQVVGRTPRTPPLTLPNYEAVNQKESKRWRRRSAGAGFSGPGVSIHDLFWDPRTHRGNANADSEFRHGFSRLQGGIWQLSVGRSEGSCFRPRRK